MTADSTRPPGAVIPARIIQTARSRDLGPLARASARNLQLLHPEWEYCFFDDADVDRFVATEFPSYQKAFAAFPRRIQQIDFFRYLAVYRLGGFYFDLDVLLAEQLDDLRDRGGVFPFEELTLNRYLREERGLDWEIGNYAFGATAGHPFLASVIENCLRAQHDRAWLEPLRRGVPALFWPQFEVLLTTGPGMLTRTLADYRPSTDDMTILFPDNLDDPRSWHRFGRYGIHLMEASWRERGNFFLRKAALYWETRTRRRFRTARRSTLTPPAVARPRPA